MSSAEFIAMLNLTAGQRAVLGVLVRQADLTIAADVTFAADATRPGPPRAT